MDSGCYETTNHTFGLTAHSNYKSRIHFQNMSSRISLQFKELLMDESPILKDKKVNGVTPLQRSHLIINFLIKETDVGLSRSAFLGSVSPFLSSS